MFKTEKEILMYFHTSLRNVGLMTSISLALQAYSTRVNINSKAVSIYFAHLVFLALAIYVNILFIQDLRTSKNSFEKVIENRWINVPYVIITFLIIMFMMNFYTFTNKFFKLMK
jgi:hypothetical protein